MPPKHLKILAFDTSAAQCAAVLLSDGQIIAKAAEVMGRTQVQRFFPFLNELLDGAGVTWQQLDALAVCTGPGNFTGTRIGVSAARSLMMSLSIPAVGVSVFEAGAMAASQPSGPVKICTALPRNQFGIQEFEAGDPPVATGAPYISETGSVDAFSIVGLAKYATAKLESGNEIPRPAPLYLRAADAAPAKDKPPVILDAI